MHLYLPHLLSLKFPSFLPTSLPTHASVLETSPLSSFRSSYLALPLACPDHLPLQKLIRAPSKLPLLNHTPFIIMITFTEHTS